MTPPACFADMIDPIPRADIAHPTLSALATLNAENALPIDPIEPKLPIEPIDSIEERLQMLRIESSDAIDHRETIGDSLPLHRTGALVPG